MTARGIHIQEMVDEHGHICTLGITKEKSVKLSYGVPKCTMGFLKCPKWKSLPVDYRSHLSNYTVRPSLPISYRDSQEYLVLNE